VLQNLLHQKLGGGVDVGVQPSGGVKPATEVVFLAISVQHLIVNVSSFHITLSRKEIEKESINNHSYLTLLPNNTTGIGSPLGSTTLLSISFFHYPYIKY